MTACPHCFNAIGNEYRQLGGNYEVVHHSTYLSRLVEEGRLRDRRGRRGGAPTAHHATTTPATWRATTA